ncbi:Serine/threonine-protein kinase-like domain protein [Methanotorris formicicus Mc-S-70]|uniref:Serine/threonine-protein kinase-like domain protein n=2 Tax=Methanotorris formicicus TaxID=213185 RepID=H1L0Y7_9EURY|nr:protein kinase [Methanotorris formicicus]EHP84293.1 Serine/threonine-protein kinase-like domain protein [Methanotorris formicicus Mc-S-70]
MLIWAKLNHQNIARLYNYSTNPLFHEIEYCGKNLKEVYNSIKSEERIFKIIFDVSEGLKHAHTRNILHRNLTSANVMFDGRDAKISNWYCARYVNRVSRDLQKPYSKYLAPEMILKKKEGFYTDIWQLGVLFYELTTGRVPFNNKDEILNIKVVHPYEIINKCLSKRRKRRYQSVEDFQNDLKALINEKYENFVENKEMFKGISYCCDLLLICLKNNDGVNAYKYLDDLIEYVDNNSIKEDLKHLKESIKYRLENHIPIPKEIIYNAEIITHKIKLVK